MPGIIPEKLMIPDYYLDQSNLISHSEGVLLWWYEMCYEMANPLQTRRLSNFSTSFQDCLPIVAAIQTYVGTTAQKLFSGIRVGCTSEDDFRSNADKVLFAINEVGLQSHITVQDLYKPSQRELLLFLAQLFFALPHYIPKREPIVF